MRRGHETDATIEGLGSMYTWNIVSPRLGVTCKLTGDGRTILRASYGRFSQGVLTGEIGSFHPGVTPTTDDSFDPATGGYTRPISVVDPKTNLLLDPHTRAPRTDEYSVGVDREIGRRPRGGDRLRPQGRRELHRVDRRRRSISQGDAAVARRSQPPVFALDTAVTPASARAFC